MRSRKRCATLPTAVSMRTYPCAEENIRHVYMPSARASSTHARTKTSRSKEHACLMQCPFCLDSVQACKSVVGDVAAQSHKHSICRRL